MRERIVMKKKKKEWVIRTAKIGRVVSPELDKYLKQGFEPFAVTGQQSDVGFIVWMKRRS